VTLAEVDDVVWLADARWVADELLRLFRDEAGGGFFTTGADAESLIVRPKEYQDNATPAENSLAAHGLLRLAAITGDDRYEVPPAEVLGLLGPVLAEHATAFAYLLGALERLVTPPLEVAVVAPSGAVAGSGSAPADGKAAAVAEADGAALRREVHGRLLPASVTVTAAPGAGADLTPLLADRGLVDGKPTAYVCEHFACRRPVTAPEDLRAQLDEALAARRG
jgi:uncharacterized protein